MNQIAHSAIGPSIQGRSRLRDRVAASSKTNPAIRARAVPKVARAASERAPIAQRRLPTEADRSTTRKMAKKKAITSV